MGLLYVLRSSQFVNATPIYALKSFAQWLSHCARILSHGVCRLKHTDRHAIFRELALLPLQAIGYHQFTSTNALLFVYFKIGGDSYDRRRDISIPTLMYSDTTEISLVD
jgi:hypothetical protein